MQQKQGKEKAVITSIIYNEIVKDQQEENNDEPIAPESEDPELAFGFREAFIIGGIVGQAYEEALDEKEERNKKNNDGEDLI